MKKLVFLILLATQFTFAQKTIQVNGLGKTSAFPNAATLTIQLEHIKPTLREAVT